MKKTILIILLVLFTMLIGAVDAAAAEKENTGVVKAVFKALKTKDMPTLDKLMAPEPAAEMKRHTSGWAEEVKTRIDDVFGAGDKVTVRWTATGLKDRRFGLDWTINCISIFQIDKGKVIKMWNGNDFLFAMRKNRIDLVSSVSAPLEYKLKATMSDVHVIGRVVSTYMEDYHHTPKAKTIK
ncbi:MAG: nuclear transport factor 2 family protein, partial [bacterium]|nr:nuclear transport factor 2 family protein [bacterium]